MKFLYCPWRSRYSQTNGHGKTEETTEKECIFCYISKEKQDEKNFILKRFAHNFVMLNRFPYNAGHLLIVPFAHAAQLSDVNKEARVELIELTTHSISIVKETLEAHGTNTGINFGKAAGAGIPSHYHMHILPRWLGDTNFLPTLTGTKQISFDLHHIYQQLKPSFDTIEQEGLV